MAEYHKELLSFPPPPPRPTFVNEHVSVRTEGTYRVILVHGVVFAHYDVGDRVAEAYAMRQEFLIDALVDYHYLRRCNVQENRDALLRNRDT